MEMIIIILAIKADNTFQLKETSLGFRVVILQIEIIGCYVGGTVNSSIISEQNFNFFLENWRKFDVSKIKKNLEQNERVSGEKGQVGGSNKN